MANSMALKITLPRTWKTSMPLQAHVYMELKKSRYTRAPHKETKLLIYCSTYNLIKLVSFKVLPSTLDTPLPAFFPGSYNTYAQAFSISK
jgi:hypothetical protein